jgi:hypothetical protein
MSKNVLPATSEVVDVFQDPTGAKRLELLEARPVDAIVRS